MLAYAAACTLLALILAGWLWLVADALWPRR